METKSENCTDNGKLEKGKDLEMEEVPTNTGPRFGARHTQVILLFLLVTIAYAIRVNLSVGIVAMTSDHGPPGIPTYDWDDTNVILSSFFWGYVIPQIGAGQLAKNFGPRYILISAMSLCSMFSILIPFMASLGSYGVMICRVFQGFGQGFFYPCAHNILSKWVPLGERTRMGTFVYAGGPFGTVISNPVTAWICDSVIGWPAAFYIFGGVGFLWVICYAILGSNTVEDHKSITDEEKNYIKGTLKQNEVDHSEIPTPWKDMFMSMPMWAILIAHCGQNWGFWTLLTQIPKYMDKILGFNLNANGLLSAVPYLALWILSFVFGALSDLFINKGVVSVGTARKVTTSIGLFGPALALLGLGFVSTEDPLAPIVLLVVAVGINSATYCGYQVNHIDLSPNHAGTLMGITNGAANIFSIIAPLSVQFIVPNEYDADQWKVVFFLSAGIYIICAIFYLIFGSGERQKWDDFQPIEPVKEAMEDKEEKVEKF
ncbi:PREDICTED: putative inorganic phosphate cotransporter [Nicrophorus vespilloides]|uniref:Inorganic phosphate cotransporter n=1 Tax=Nicrophorus vespilloides TaxID=110193 RepID=A0ABM1NDW4_NICVS|nr:PREDICTED: putative inorganic phosphate cotransporter [Nicrophorus vespilloides]